jgi:predicted metalloprotease
VTLFLDAGQTIAYRCFLPSRALVHLPPQTSLYALSLSLHGGSHWRYREERRVFLRLCDLVLKFRKAKRDGNLRMHTFVPESHYLFLSFPSVKEKCKVLLKRNILN